MARDITQAELREIVATIQSLDGYDMVALKGHVLTEIALQRLLATRLGTSTDKLPRLKFEHLARLAFAGVDDTPGLASLVRVLGELRNRYAHDPIPKATRL